MNQVAVKFLSGFPKEERLPRGPVCWGFLRNLLRVESGSWKEQQFGFTTQPGGTSQHPATPTSVSSFLHVLPLCPLLMFPKGDRPEVILLHLS